MAMCSTTSMAGAGIRTQPGYRMWNGYPQYFRELMVNGMRYDYSWNHPAGII